MNKLLESLDNKVLTPELRGNIEILFNEAVERKLSEKEAEYEQKLNEAKENIEVELSLRLDSYLNTIVEEWMNENTLVLESEVKSSKLDALLEGFEAMLVAGGIEALNIVEAKNKIAEEDDEDSECKCKKVNEDEAEAIQDDTEIENDDKLVKENEELKEKLDSLILKGVVLEVAQGLNEAQLERFKELSNNIDKSDKRLFIEELEKTRAFVVESVKETQSKVIVESTDVVGKYVPKAAHLIRKK